MSTHSTFILSPIEGILSDAMNVICTLSGSMASFPIWEYILQSVFLKMTGAQEQKMKCICWEISSVDYEIRRKIFNKWEFGECSTLKHKQTILKHLHEAIKHINEHCDIERKIDLNTIFLNSTNLIDEFYEKSGVKGFMCRPYMEYKQLMSHLSSNCLSITSIFKNCANCTHRGDSSRPEICAKSKGLSSVYERLYIHRNRCAHNILSYQQNKPELNMLYNVEHIYDNYFFRFLILIIIDKLFIELYKVFKSEIELSELF